MKKQDIRSRIAETIRDDGLVDTGIEGVKLFRATTAVPCAPAVYEPCVIAIVSGSKEAALHGHRHVYGSSRYLCCPMSMPVEAGTPAASSENPLLGVYISLAPRMMTELTVEMENAGSTSLKVSGSPDEEAIGLAQWDDDFTDALLRLLQATADPVDRAVLGKARLHELYYAILKGEVGPLARQAFGVGNAIARSIAHVSANLEEPVSIDDLANRAGMSRAVFHRRFKSATTMSPIQFVKSMRLNHAALKIAGGMTVNEAAMEVGYVSPSQFSREFKRTYGKSPREWSHAEPVLAQFA